MFNNHYTQLHDILHQEYFLNKNRVKVDFFKCLYNVKQNNISKYIKMKIVNIYLIMCYL